MAARACLPGGRRPAHRPRVLILGSASPALLRQSSESLAGRQEIVEVDGLSLAETGVSRMAARWVRGGLPLSFVAPTPAMPVPRLAAARAARDSIPQGRVVARLAIDADGRVTPVRIRESSPRLRPRSAPRRAEGVRLDALRRSERLRHAGDRLADPEFPARQAGISWYRSCVLIERARLRAQVSGLLQQFRGVLLVGPRQVGKTTLARSFVPPGSPNYFDLEDPVVAEQFRAPKALLSDLRGLVVIDEVQHAPNLFPLLRVLMDREGAPAKFLLLGSVAMPLLRQGSESLLGRIAVVEVDGFALDEVGTGNAARLWRRGGAPPSFLAEREDESVEWRERFIQLFLERDLPQMGIRVAAPAMRRFWTMLAHYHGQTWNAADPARSLGVNESTVRRYLDWLTNTYMVRQLPPWFENLGKRQVKAPKVYFRDSGLLHTLMGVRTEADLLSHPRLGASWEGFALEQVLRLARADEAYFWATHTGAELDLLMLRYGRRVGVEFKYADAPRLTPSMRIASSDLKLDALYVVYPGDRRYPLADNIETVPLAHFASAP
jgi:predicted AAA+ superfamily ATPase